MLLVNIQLEWCDETLLYLRMTSLISKQYVTEVRVQEEEGKGEFSAGAAPDFMNMKPHTMFALK